MYARTAANTLKYLERQFPAVLVTGARQVGKSTLLRQSHPDIPYVTLDDPDLRVLAATDPKLFVQRYPAPLIIDEVQYAPSLFSVLKLMIDENRRPGMYWLSGSQQFEMMRNVSDSLAGRLGILELAGLSTRELVNDAAAPPFLPPAPTLSSGYSELDLYQRIWRGSYPELHARPDSDPTAFYRSYVATYLQRDVRDLAQVGDLAAFMQFMEMLAGRVGQILVLAELSRDANIPYSRAATWLSVLEASGLIVLLRAYHSSHDKRLVKAPKLYFMDTGLAAYLTKWPTPETLMAGAAAPAFLENYAVTEILKSYLHHGKQPPMFYYRNHDQKELDIVLVTNHTLYPMDVKRSATIDRRTAQRLHIAESLKLRQGRGLILCGTANRYPLTEDVDAYPVGWL